MRRKNMLYITYAEVSIVSWSRFKKSTPYIEVQADSVAQTIH